MKTTTGRTTINAFRYNDIFDRSIHVGPRGSEHRISERDFKRVFGFLPEEGKRVLFKVKTVPVAVKALRRSRRTF